jgi:hypothetical protein
MNTVSFPPVSSPLLSVPSSTPTSGYAYGRSLPVFVYFITLLTYGGTGGIDGGEVHSIVRVEEQAAGF